MVIGKQHRKQEIKCLQKASEYNKLQKCKAIKEKWLNLKDNLTLS